MVQWLRRHASRRRVRQAADGDAAHPGTDLRGSTWEVLIRTSHVTPCDRRQYSAHASHSHVLHKRSQPSPQPCTSTWLHQPSTRAVLALGAAGRRHASAVGRCRWLGGGALSSLREAAALPPLALGTLKHEERHYEAHYDKSSSTHYEFGGVPRPISSPLGAQLGVH